MKNAGDNIESCAICGIVSSWDGSDGSPNLWGCEGKCGDTFCEQCFEVSHGAKTAHEMFSMDGSIEKILCPTCYTHNISGNNGEVEPILPESTNVRCLVEICIYTDGDFSFDGHELFTKIDVDYEHHIWIADFPSVDKGLKGTRMQLSTMKSTATGRKHDVFLFKEGMNDWIDSIDWCIANIPNLGSKNWDLFTHDVSNQSGSLRIYLHNGTDALITHMEILRLMSHIGLDSFDYYHMLAKTL